MNTIRVLITRTADAAGALYQELTSGFAGSGFDLEISCVPVRVASFAQDCLASASLPQLLAGEFDWLTFTSANGVLGFARLADSLSCSAMDLKGTARIACVGKSTAKALDAQGVTPDFVPAVQDAQHMVSDWPVSDSHHSVLCIQGSNARSTLVEGLKGWGFDAIPFTVYTMEEFPALSPLVSHTGKKPILPELPMHDVLPLLPRTQLLIATAPSLLREIYEEYRGHGGGSETFPPVVAIGNTTAEEARTLGLQVTVAEHPQPVFLAKAAKSVADLQFQCAKLPTNTE